MGFNSDKGQITKDLKDLLNSAGMDDYLDIPDYILAEYVIDNLLLVGKLKQKVKMHENGVKIS